MKYINLKGLNDAIFRNKTYEEVADEVIFGKWGYGSDQINRLTAAGYDYSVIQNIVNIKLTIAEMLERMERKRLMQSEIADRIIADRAYDNHVLPSIVNEKIAQARKCAIKKIIFNQKACIVFWEDGTKTVVKRKANDKFDKYAAVAQAMTKHLYGSTSAFHKMVDKLATFQPMTKLGD